MPQNPEYFIKSSVESYISIMNMDNEFLEGYGTSTPIYERSASSKASLSTVM